MREIKLRPKAIGDMESIWDYTVHAWDSEQAEHYLRSIQRAFDLLATNPTRGRNCNHIRKGYRNFSLDVICSFTARRMPH